MWQDVYDYKKAIIFEVLAVPNDVILRATIADFEVARRVCYEKSYAIWESYIDRISKDLTDLRLLKNSNEWIGGAGPLLDPELLVAGVLISAGNAKRSFQSRIDHLFEDDSMELIYLSDQWKKCKNEFFRERGLLGPQKSCPIDRWMLDSTEGFARMRRRLVRNPDFYSLYRAHHDQSITTFSSLIKTTNILAKSPKSAHVDRLFQVLAGRSINDVSKVEIKREKSTPDSKVALDASMISLLTGKKNDSDSDDDEVEDREDNQQNNQDEQSQNGVSFNSVDMNETLELADDLTLSLDQSIRKLIGPDEKIREFCRCARITPVSAMEGVLIFGQCSYYIIDGYTVNKDGEIVRINQMADNEISLVLPRLVTSKTNEAGCCLKFRYGDIREVLKRRYLLQAIAIEIFSSNGQNILLAFQKNQRNPIYSRFLSVSTGLNLGKNQQQTILGQRNITDFESQSTFLHSLLGERSVTQRWERGEYSNFEYLMFLNTIAGRSYNDLMQYPIFPWILADYDSPKLDLRSETTFRDLSKPMGAQTSERFSKFQERYDDWENYDTNGVQIPYHYNTHYSSAMIVASYLIRLEPFSQVVVNLQGGLFDLPDRTFHSIKESWLSASKNNMSDVKELIPEFFYLPEFLINENDFYFGVKQTGELVNNIVLPQWSKGDPREFIRLHRAALESDYVSAHLHEWIDLIFGFKQKGRPAIDSGNVFHPLFYEGAVDFELIDDPTTKEATIGFINNFGQVPRQIFRRPHVQKKLSRRLLDSLPDHATYLKNHDLFFKSIVSRLKIYLVKELKCVGGCESIVSLSSTRVIAFPRRRTALFDQSGNILRRYIDWDYTDGSLRIVNLENEKTQCISSSMNDLSINCLCATSSHLIIGAVESPFVYVHKLVYESSSSIKLEFEGELTGHHHHDQSGPITALAVCDIHRLIVSGSTDSTAIIWDLNTLFFIRQIMHHDEDDEGRHRRTSSSTTIRCIRIHETTANIVTCTDYLLFVWTVNGDLLAKLDSRSVDLMRTSKFTALDISTIYDWDTDNVIITGSSSGVVRLWRLQFKLEDEKSDSCASHLLNKSFIEENEVTENEFVVVTDDDVQKAFLEMGSHNQQQKTFPLQRLFNTRNIRGRDHHEDQISRRLSIDLSNEDENNVSNETNLLKITRRPGTTWKRVLVLAATYELPTTDGFKSPITSIHIPSYNDD